MAERDEDLLVKKFSRLELHSYTEDQYDKLIPVIESALANKKDKKEGERIYSNWAKCNFKWSTEDYEHEGFQAIYTEKLFKCRAKLVKEAIGKAVEKGYLDQGFLKSVKTVTSFGCGPGPDLIGFKAYMCEEMKKRTSGITFIGYDAVDWKPYHDELGTEFVECNIDQSFIKRMQESDVLLMSYFASSAKFSVHNKDEPSNWDTVIGKAKLILVLDINDPHQNISLSKRNFKELILEDGDRKVYVHVYRI